MMPAAARANPDAVDNFDISRGLAIEDEVTLLAQVIQPLVQDDITRPARAELAPLFA
jgi:hypothetical protein